MIQPLVPLIGMIAFGAWVVAALSLIGVLRLVPHGQRVSAVFSAGFWQFEKVRKLGGQGVDAHLHRFVWAFAVFFLAIIVSMFVAMALSIEAQNATGAAQSAASVSVTPSASLES